MKIALAMIVKGEDKEAQIFEQCLKNVRKYVDDAYITITHKPEWENTGKVEAVATKYDCVVSSFDWINDFAAARNFNFKQVPGYIDYILWLDSDDVVRGLEKLRLTITEHPADVYALYYLYAFDNLKNPVVVHQKSQIVKNDGCVTWVGSLHEDFKKNRDVSVYLIKGIERIHTSTAERFEEAKWRNYEISQKQIEENPDDPRHYFNFGTCAGVIGKNIEAIEAFDKFLAMSESEEEKFIVKLRRASCQWALGDVTGAIESARLALGTRPNYPDAYHALGRMFYDLRRYKEAAAMFVEGLTKKPPYLESIVYNPREYDYVPMMNLARVYIAMERPDAALPMLEGANKINPSNDLRNTIKEIKKKKVEFNRVVKIIKKIENIEDKKRLAKELDKIPDKLKSHPSICIIRNKAFVKETSSGKDLVFFCGFTARQWTPDTVKEGIGGSEEAIITLTKKLADRGWNVTVYNNCGYKEQRFGKVLYKPFWTFNYRDKQDIVIGWRIPALCDWGVNAKRIYIDLHDVIPSGEFNKTRLERIYKIFVKSKFQRNLYPDIPDEKFVIIPNGIDAELFSLDLPKNKNLMINTSSPDRSLNALCDLFKEVRKKVPAARCQWAYGWDVFDTAHSGSAIKMQWKADLIKKMAESGVEDLGRVSHEEVAKMYLTANIFAYPSEFAEIDCISLSKAMAAGAIPVTSDFSALGEKTGHGGVFIHSEKNNDTWAKPFQYDFGLEGEEKRKEWVEAVVKLLENPPGDEDRKEMRQWSRETFDWNKIADLWDKELKG